MAAEASPGPASQVLTGWGRRPRSRSWVYQPADPAALAGLLRDGAWPRGLLARGLGRSYNDAALNAGGGILCTSALQGVEAFDAANGSVSLQAGVSIERLLRAVVPHGWFPAVVPGTAQVTVGGAIAADIHGKNHHRDGGFGRWTDALTLQTPEGELRVVTRHDDPDAFRATVGGMGLTGVVTDATLRLLPIESAWMRVETLRTSDLDATMVRMVERDVVHRYAVAWLDLAPGSPGYGRGVLTNGDHASRDELPGKLQAAPLAARAPAALTVPDLVPSGLLRGGALRALNAAWYRLSRPGTSLQPVGKYFFPLDRLAEWNRVYGKRGFVQYQVVVPDEETLRAVVERLRAARCPVALAVLKRFGADEGYLSFPMPGWTLSVDIPVGAENVPGLLDRCDELVAAAGGRVYLAKDARARPDAVKAMYPGYRQWRDARDRLDPEHRARSDLARRLDLMG